MAENLWARGGGFAKAEYSVVLDVASWSAGVYMNACSVYDALPVVSSTSSSEHQPAAPLQLQSPQTSFRCWSNIYLCFATPCRLEELRHPLLASLAAALPSIGNGLAAIVSYGEAHVFMLQLQSTVTAAHARATAASQAISEAAADEVRALTSGATSAKNVTSLTSDYRRLCGLAASCISSAGSWLSRHIETLLAWGASGSRDSAGSGSALQSLLDVTGSNWDAALADRPLLLLTSNAAATDQNSSSRTGGVLLQALGSFLPAGAGAGGADGGGAAAAELQALLPPELLQHCLQLDTQGGQLLVQQQELLAQGRWSLACYAAVLKQLLSGGL